MDLNDSGLSCVSKAIEQLKMIKLESIKFEYDFFTIDGMKDFK